MNTFKVDIKNTLSLVNTIPMDDQKYKVSIYDEDQMVNVLYTQNNGSLAWYIKSGKKYFPLFASEPMYDNKHLSFKRETITFLKELCPDFSDLRDLIDNDISQNNSKADRAVSRQSGTALDLDWNIDTDPISKTKIIKGCMQSRKTWMIVAMSMYYYLFYKVSVFIVIENKLSSCEQMMLRIRNVFDKYISLIGAKDLQTEFERMFQVLDVKRGKSCGEQEMQEALSGKSPRIFIALRSEYDLCPVNDIIEKSNQVKYALILDESDAIDNGSESWAQDELNYIKDSANIVWNVTATAMTSLMKEYIVSGNVFVMKKPEDYKDLPTFNMIQLDKESESCSDVDDDPFDKDPNLKNYLEDFSKKGIYFDPVWGGRRHPVISLVRVGITIEPQLRLAEFIQSNHTITCITFNGSGEGLTLRGHGLPKSPIKIGKNTSILEKEVHNFSDLQIGDAISYLQENGGVDRYPRIVIIAGKMADRGITFGSSNYSECISQKQVPWHLTEMYYLAAKGTDQPNLLQAAGRLCGVYIDNIPLTLYSNACDDIVKAYHAQEELIDRARKANREEQSMKDIIPTIEMSKEKCSKRRFTSPKVPCRIKKVKDDSIYGGWDWEAEGRMTLGGETKSTIITTCDEDSKIIQKIHKLMSSSRKDKITIFVSMLKPLQRYKEKDILNMLRDAGYNQPASFFSSINKKTNYGIGHIFEKVQDGWMIRSVLNSAWEM
jgi:hypothetical protein